MSWEFLKNMLSVFRFKITPERKRCQLELMNFQLALVYSLKLCSPISKIRQGSPQVVSTGVCYRHQTIFGDKMVIISG